MFSLSAGNCGDGPEGRALLQKLNPTDHPLYLLMDEAFEGDETQTLAVELGYIPVVPPKSNRKNPWSYDTQLYKQRNQVERLFRRIKRFRRISLAMINLTLFFLPLSIWFLLLMHLCEHCLRETVQNQSAKRVNCGITQVLDAPMQDTKPDAILTRQPTGIILKGRSSSETFPPDSS